MVPNELLILYFKARNLNLSLDPTYAGASFTGYAIYFKQVGLT